MRIEQDRAGQLKNYIYIAGSALLFITWCLSLAALTQTGSVSGRLAWVFGLCFLTIPMLIYQSLTPVWSRTARFSNPHVHCVVDGLLSVFWFSAWVSLASYVVSGKGHGDAKNSTGNSKSGCDNFAFGSSSKCKISEADIFFALLLMLVFMTTSFFSFKVLMEYRRTGIVPQAAHLGGSKFDKTDIGYPHSVHSTAYKEEDEAFDSRLDVERDGRANGHSFEDARVQGGAPAGGYGGLGVPVPYSGYSSVPEGDEHSHEIVNARPISFGGPLNRIR